MYLIDPIRSQIAPVAKAAAALELRSYKTKGDARLKHNTFKRHNPGAILVFAIVAANCALMAIKTIAAETDQPGRVRLLLPPKIYAVPGIETNLYFDNVVLVLNPRNYAFDVNCPKGMQLDERWTFTPAAKDVGDYPIEITVRDESNNVVAEGHSIVHVVPKERGSEQPTTLLIVGDSYTEASIYPQHLLDLAIHDDRLHLKFIGCRGPDDAPAQGELRDEGYSGWTAEAFVTMRGPYARSGQYVPSQTGSPFVYDDAGGKAELDFGRYCKQFNDGHGPDAISICLGVNDIFTATDENIEQRVDTTIGYFDQLVDAFHKVRPDTEIGVVLVTPPSRSQDGFRNYTGAGRQTRWQYRRNLHRLLEKLVKHFGGRESEHIYIVPAYINIDAERDFPTWTSHASTDSTVDLVRVNNGSHPSEAGYFKIADSIYCWLKAVTPPGTP